MRVIASRVRFVVVLGVLTASGPCPVARAADNGPKYYMAVFAFQTDPNLAESSHSFATFIKEADTAPNSKNESQIDSHTISWMPASLDVRLILTRRGIKKEVVKP